MNKKLIIQLFAAVFFLVSGFLAVIRGVVEPSERSALTGIALMATGAYLLFIKDNNRRELKPVRVRARN